jgi:hypothetical protein
LENDTRDDDVAVLLASIRQLRGVLSVSGNIADPAAYMAEERAKRELGDKLWQVLHPKA